MPSFPHQHAPHLLAFAVFAAAGCAPVASLHVSQSGVCKGYKVAIVWNGTGDRFELQSAPIDATTPSASEPVDGSETLTETLDIGTEFRLVAFRRHEEKRSDWQPVRVLEGGKSHPFLVDVNTCEGATISAKHPDPSLSAASREYAANIWGGILVDTVALETGDWHVEHAGRAADLRSGEKSALFKGAPMNGEWTFRMTLPSGATCDQAPRRLLLDVYPQCP